VRALIAPPRTGASSSRDRAREEWIVIDASFEAAVADLRRTHRQLEGRKARATIAVRVGEEAAGRIYATLPTQVSTAMPLHVNATFFPRMDRKGILLDAALEEEWNRAAIQAAAEALAANVTPLSRSLGPERFWQLVAAASRLDRHPTAEIRVLAPFWQGLAAALPDAEVMWTSAGAWSVVRETVLPPRSDVGSRLLAALEIPTVARSIRASVPDRRLSVRALDVARLVDAIETLDLEDGAAPEHAPQLLGDDQLRDELRRLLAELLKPRLGDEDLEERIKSLPIWRDADGGFSSFAASYRVDASTARTLNRFVSTPLIAWPRARSLRDLGELGDPLTMQQAITSLHTSGGAPDRDTSLKVLVWLRGRLADLTPKDIAALRKVRLVPTVDGIAAAERTVRPGGFRDRLAVAGILDVAAIADVEDVIERLQIKRLTFADYLRDHLPEALGDGKRASVEGLVALIRECARRRDEIDQDDGLVRMLTAESWIPCRDGYRRPPAQVYFDSPDVLEVLGNDAPLVWASIKRRGAPADFLRALGADDRPRPADVVNRVTRLTEQAPTDRTRSAVRRVLRFLNARDVQDPSSPLAQLRTIDWLPAEHDHNSWHVPREVHRTRYRHLFTTSGRFIGLSRQEQDAYGSVLTALQVGLEPSLTHVVTHVRNLAAAGKAPSGEILTWLDKHAADGSVDALGHVPFLTARDGSLHRPREVFRQAHPLSARLPVLAPAVVRHAPLLNALDVPSRPTAEHAEALLIELTEDAAEGALLSTDALRLVRSCWTVFSLHPSHDLSGLGGRVVVPATDGTIWRADQVVINDQSAAMRWLSVGARQRVIRDDGLGATLQRAGVRRLSETLIAEVEGRAGARRDEPTEGWLLERQAQLARVIVGEGGSPAVLLRFAEGLKVRSLRALRLRYSLEGMRDVAGGNQVRHGAYYDRASGELLVEGGLDDVDWRAVAGSIKDTVLPQHGPSVVMPLELVLEAPDADAAEAILTRLEFPPLEGWSEFSEILNEWIAAREPAARGEGEKPEAEEPDQENRVVGGRPEDTETPGMPAEDGEDETSGDGHDDGDLRDEGPADDEGYVGGEDNTDDAASFGHDEDAIDEEDDEQAEDGYEDDEADDDTEGDTGSGDGRGATDGRRGRTPSGSRSGSSGGTSRGTGGRRAGSPGRRSAADRRLISYVLSESTEPSRGGAGGDRTQAGDAGVDLVVRQLRDELSGTGHVVIKMPNGNKGYDVEVRDRTSAVVRYVEVKSTEDRWGAQGVGLSRPQFDLARQEKDRFWLYVVERLYEPDARIWWIRDPASQVGTFQYDHGWSNAADGSSWVEGARRPSTI
jgi:hypothetical protein